MSTCPVCGRVHLIVWPQFWPYRRDARLFCSEDCLIVYVTQQNFSKYKGVQKKMARLKKDGTPAKKPGRKPNKIEIPEPVSGGEWEKVETPEAPDTLVVDRKKMEIPELPKITLPVTYDGMTIREVEGLFGRYRYTDIGSAVYIDFENADNMDTLSFTVEQWRKFREEQTKAAAILGVEL